jgi:hypothetical protein
MYAPDFGPDTNDPAEREQLAPPHDPLCGLEGVPCPTCEQDQWDPEAEEIFYRG